VRLYPVLKVVRYEASVTDENGVELEINAG
jgi:hypothetical protein